MIRTLIDATKTLGNDFRRSGTDFFSAVFLRNDVYESLLSQTSDRGKDSTVLGREPINWSGRRTSALVPITDSSRAWPHVRKVPTSDITKPVPV